MKKKKKSKDQSVKELRKRISELEKSEMILRENQANQYAMLESLPDFMIIINKELEIVWMNEKMKELFGEGAIGQKCYEAIQGRKTACENCYTLKTFRDGKPHKKVWKNRDEDGNVQYFDTITNVALRDGDGNPLTVLEISRDITERKKAEELLKKQKEELSEFAHTVFHALKNYIGVIRICAQFLLLRRKYTEKYVQRIDDMVTKIDEFITQQLQLANAGRAIGEPEEIDLNTVIDEVGKMYSIEIHSEDLPTITGDPRRLREAFHNLIDNAIKHGKANKIEIFSRKKEDSYVISVRDNGKGISKEDIDKIFDIGYSKRGTGFGLTIVKKIVEAHGGSISVKSKEEKGTVFELVLPIKM